MKLDRYGKELELLLLLTDNNKYTAKQLAEKLGMTTRMLYYYFDYLRECDFRLMKEGSHYRLDSSSPFFKKLHVNMSLTHDEADYLCRVLSRMDTRSPLSRNIQTKLQHHFHLQDYLDADKQKQLYQNIRLIQTAIESRMIAVLKNYSSPHSQTVADRVVEPFMLMNENMDVRCYEIKSHTCKTYKISRIGHVEITNVEWIHEDKHRAVYTDLFMFSGEEKTRVTLQLDQLSYNLLIEEYPDAVTQVTTVPDGHWLFSTEVVSFAGIGRFVLGLLDNIDIVDSPEFEDYIYNKVKGYQKKYLSNT